MTFQHEVGLLLLACDQVNGLYDVSPLQCRLSSITINRIPRANWLKEQGAEVLFRSKIDMLVTAR